MQAVLISAFLGVWQGMCTLSPPYDGLEQLPMRFTLSPCAQELQSGPAEFDYVIDYVNYEPPRRYILRERPQKCAGCFELDEQNGIILPEVLSPDGKILTSVFKVPNSQTKVIESVWRVLPAARHQKPLMRVTLTSRASRAVNSQVLAVQDCLLHKL